MCELFGLSASQRIAGSALPLAEFQSRGGATADNPDGWGIAWREDGDFRLEREPLPGHGSARFAKVIESLHSDLLIAHVRKARWPPVNTLGNTHRFVHPCCGRQWVFAHNGLVPELVTMESANPAKACRPVCETDSEFAFCHLLSHVMGYYPTPSAERPWLEVLATISELIAGHGKFNFLLSDCEHLIAYGHDRLHHREWHDDGVDFALIATEALGDAPGWWAIRGGRVAHLPCWRAGGTDIDDPPKSGHRTLFAKECEPCVIRSTLTTTPPRRSRQKCSTRCCPGCAISSAIHQARIPTVAARRRPSRRRGVRSRT